MQHEVLWDYHCISQAILCQKLHWYKVMIPLPLCQGQHSLSPEEVAWQIHSLVFGRWTLG